MNPSCRSSISTESPLAFHPLTPDRWSDFETLFGPRGACAGCWCMFRRLPRKSFDAGKGDANRAAMRTIVHQGECPGLLAYAGARTVGWCALAPRADYPALARSGVLRPVDDAPVWSVSCFFVVKDCRKRGVSVALLRAAADYAAAQGAAILEGYPVEPTKTPAPAAFVWTGLASAFRDAGFEECARRSPTRPIMRKHLPR